MQYMQSHEARELPAMRQQFPDPVVRMRGQTREHISQIRIGVVTVYPGRLHQTHDGGRPFSGSQGARK